MFYMNAFSELGTTRPSGFGTGRIPFTAIVEYAKIYQVDDFDTFMYIIRIMDNKVIDLNNNKSRGKDANGKEQERNAQG